MNVCEGFCEEIGWKFVCWAVAHGEQPLCDCVVSMLDFDVVVFLRSVVVSSLRVDQRDR